jgi:dihydrofolate synthase/folylpolyglutamate synthase
MTYEEAQTRLAALGPELRTGRTGDKTTTGTTPRKFALEHMRTLLTALGEPQRSFPSVLIAGTNGKGSTAATLAAIANAAGLRTGLYTSPHLERVTERIRLSNPGHTALDEIPGDTFGELFGRVDAAAAYLVTAGQLPHHPSYFELMTAVGFLYFAEQHIDLAVLEVGLGGRLDATNTVEPLVSIITDIGIDHTEFLGNTITLIATEKAGILRQDGVLVTLSQHPEANAAIGEVAVRLNVRGVDASRCLPPQLAHAAVPPEQVVGLAAGVQHAREVCTPLAPNTYDLSIDGGTLHIASPLAGQHQQRNIALAIAAALELRTNHGFRISNDAIEAGVRNTYWPGRLEWIASPHGHAPLLLDLAHNPAGAWTVRAALAQLPEDMPRALIFSSLADKPIDEVARILLPLFDRTSGDPARTRDHIIVAPVQNPRAATLEELLAAAHRLDIHAHGAPHLAAALAQAQSITPPEGIIVATGSAFLVGELRTLALHEQR